MYSSFLSQVNFKTIIQDKNIISKPVLQYAMPSHLSLNYYRLPAAAEDAAEWSTWVTLN